MSGGRPVLATSRITRPRLRLVTGVGLGLWLSGGGWLLSHDVFVPQGEFGPSYRSADAWLLALHGAFGFAALWLLGLLWGTHIGAGWRGARRRWSGGAMLGLAGILVATGFCLYYCGDEEIRERIAVLHWGLGLAAPGAYLLHRFGRKSSIRRRP